MPKIVVTRDQTEHSCGSVFAYDDYVLVGPARDPAHVRGSPTAAEAFRRIIARKQAFCSPVDVPPLFAVERDIWSAARIDPQKDRRYKTCHGNARAVLDSAAMLAAYTLTDRATAEGMRV